jgi:TIR domain
MQWSKLMEQPIEIFCGASDTKQDQKYLKMLKKHFAQPLRERIITWWDQSLIEPGKNREKEVQQHLDSAKVFLLLISADFLASDYCYETVMKIAQEKSEEGKVRVISVIVGTTAGWDSTILSALQPLPRDQKPIKVHPSNERDRLFAEIVGEVIGIIHGLVPAAPSSIGPSTRALLLGSLGMEPPLRYRVWNRFVTGAFFIGAIVSFLLTFLILFLLSRPPDDTLVTNLMDQDVIAAKTHSVAFLPQIYAYDAVVVDAGCQSSSPSSTWSGLPAITTRYEGLPTFILLAHVKVQVTWIPDNSSATQATATSDTSGIAVVNGSQLSLRGHELWTFAKSDGQWRITSFTYNLC